MLALGFSNRLPGPYLLRPAELRAIIATSSHQLNFWHSPRPYHTPSQSSHRWDTLPLYCIGLYNLTDFFILCFMDVCALFVHVFLCSSTFVRSFSLYSGFCFLLSRMLYVCTLHLPDPIDLFAVRAFARWRSLFFYTRCVFRRAFVVWAAECLWLRSEKERTRDLRCGSKSCSFN